MPYSIGFRPNSESQSVPLTQSFLNPDKRMQISNPLRVQSTGFFGSMSTTGIQPRPVTVFGQNSSGAQATSSRPSLLAALRTVYAYTNALAERRVQDGSNGVGLLSGARSAVLDSKELAKQMEAAVTLQAYEKLMQSAYANRQYTSAHPSSLPAPLEKLGSKAQGQLYKQMLDQTQKELGDIIGFDPKKFLNEIISPELQKALGGATAAAGPEIIKGADALGNVGDAAGNAAAKAGSAVGILGKATNFAGAAYSAFNLVKDWGEMPPVAGAVNGFTAGAYVGSLFGPPGSLVGGVIGAIAGAVNGLFGGGKSAAQLARDSVRDMLQKSGMIDSAWGLTLADGSTYDIGKDGGAKLQNLDGTERHAYDLDLNDPRVGQAIGWVQPLVTLLTGGDPKLTCDFTGYFVNAALSNAGDWDTVRLNIQSIYAKAGIPLQDLGSALVQMTQQGALDANKLEAYVNGVQSLFDPNYLPVEYAGQASIQEAPAHTIEN